MRPANQSTFHQRTLLLEDDNLPEDISLEDFWLEEDIEEVTSQKETTAHDLQESSFEDYSPEDLLIGEFSLEEDMDKEDKSPAPTTGENVWGLNMQRSTWRGSQRRQLK